MPEKPRLYTLPSAFQNPQRLRPFVHGKGIADRIEEVGHDMTPGGDQRK